MIGPLIAYIDADIIKFRDLPLKGIVNIVVC